ncbi:MAG TPA: dihydrofolate reductase [Microbacteriaceae bacterium]|nr:dihydrofolate reductase [Microbacteriaceae bacterium]
MHTPRTLKTIGMIWAQARQGVIGARGTVPWNVPEDLAHFELITFGHPVIMGRRTWDSLPASSKPLPGRTNIVLTRNDGWSAHGATVAHSLDEAIDALGVDEEEVWIIGGAQIYSEAVGLANLAVVTEIDHNYNGEAYAPGLGSEWTKIAADPATGWDTSASGLAYRILTYRKG